MAPPRPACGPAWPRADLRAGLRAAIQSRVRTCVRLCVAGILRPPPPSAPFGSALSRMWNPEERNGTSGGFPGLSTCASVAPFRQAAISARRKVSTRRRNFSKSVKVKGLRFELGPPGDTKLSLLSIGSRPPGSEEDTCRPSPSRTTAGAYKVHMKSLVAMVAQHSDKAVQ